MKKKRMLIITSIIILVILVILLFPTRFDIDDGGSYGYSAILYKIEYVQPSISLYPGIEHGISIHIFHCIDFFIKST